MKIIFTKLFNKTHKKQLAFCAVLLMSINAFAQVTATEDFENEATLNNVTSHTFSESGISFSTDLTFQVTSSGFGYNNSANYIFVQGTNVTKTITISNASTAFKINSFAAFVASNSGGTATNGIVTFVGTLVGGSTVTATVNVASTGSVPSGQTREANNVVNGLSFAGTPLDGIFMTSLSVSTSAAVQFVELDHISFTTQAVVTNQFSISDVSQNEGNSSTSNFTFTVTRSSNTAASSVQVQSSNGTATSGSDYTAFPLTTVNFTAGGALTQTVNVTVNGDVSVEPNETFTMTLSNPTGGVLLDATGTGTIVDDDAINEPFEDEIHQTSTFSQSGNNFQTSGKLLVKNAGNFGQGGTSGYASSTEPYAIGNQGSLQITSPGKSFNVISVDLWSAAVSGSAPNWTFTPTNGTITFTGTKADGSGTVTHTAAITPSGTNVHSTVLFAGSPFDGVQLSSISFSTPTGIQYLQVDNFKYGTATLTNTQLSIDDVSVVEGTGGGSTTATFTVTRTNNTTAFSVDLASSNGTATAGTDYTAYPITTLNFTSGGALTQTVNVTILKDASIEPDETFLMTLTNATNGTVFLKQVGTGTIQNDDSVVETFEDETHLATTFSQSGVSFSTTGGYTVRQASTFGSGSSTFYLTSSNNAVGNQGTFSITSANKAFKLNFLDAWVGTSAMAHSSGSVTFTGTLHGGGTVTTTKTITATSATGAGWQQNISFVGTPLENATLTAIQVTTAGALTECDIDNFNYTVVNTLPIIEVTDASNNAITNGGAAVTANNTDFGGACVTGGTVSKTYTIKNSGNSNLTLSGSPLAVLGGADAGQFSITTQPTSPITAVGSVTFTVQFDPSSAGTKNATITLTNNDATNSPYVINIKGTGNANPVATITPTPNPVCQNGTLNLSAATGAITYLWSGNGIVLANSNTTTAVPTATGAQTYGLTMTSSAGCTATATTSVTVNATPTASISPTPSPVCQNSTLSLSTPTGATTYVWSGNGIVLANSNTTTAVPTTTGAQTYSVTATIGSCSASATTSVTVNAQPSAPTSPTATPSNFTVAGTTTLTATGCNSPSTLTWYDSANSLVALPNNTPTISANKTFFARCTGTNTCASNPSTNVSVTYTPCVPLASSPGNVGINWTGAVSTNWNDACNWNPKWVPDATNSAVVIDLQTNQPTISTTVPSVKLIYVNSGATLTVASGGTLNASSTTAVLTLQGGNLINEGTINLSGGGTSVGLAIGATASIINRGTITTNNLYGASLQFGNLTFTNESTGIFTGDFKANNNTLTLTNRGTINYGGGTYALSLGSAGSSVVNTGTISVTAGSGISNPSGSTITNNACGKILMTGGAGLYENAGITTNAGLIQLLNTYDFTNTGTFTNNGVVKANTVSGITNNRMVITNACPIFTLSGSNNYTVSGIFTDAGATTSAGTYTSVGNKFTANNTIPTGTQTLYAQVTNGTCTFVVPFDFNNRKPTAVSVNKTTICTGANVMLSGTCPSGTALTWYTTATGGSNIGTGSSLSQSPISSTTYYAACEATNCISGRVATSEVTVVSPPVPTASSNSPVCQDGTLNMTGGGTGTYSWTGPSSFTSILQNPTISNVSTTATGTYMLTVTNAGCSASATTAITVNAIPNANPSSDSPKCVGQTLTFNSVAGMSSYAWTGPNSFSSSIQAPSISSVTTDAAGIYSLTVTNGACTASATISVSINVSATVNATPTTQTICSGSTITTIAITGTGSSYTWTRDNTAGVTGIAASGSGNISGSFTNTTEAPITVTFTITPVGTCGNGTPTTAAVVINPLPTVSASTPTQTICSGALITGIVFNTPPVAQLLLPDPSSDVTPAAISQETEGIAFNSFVAGTTFNWTRDNTATVTGIPASGTGNISGILINTTASPIMVTFTVTPSYTNAGTLCTGTPITVTVTVNPNPIAPTITDAGTAFCSGSSTTLTVSANPTYTSYAWQRSLTGIANPNSFTAFGGTAQTQTVTTSGVYRVIVGNQYNCFASDTTAVKFGDYVFNGSLAAGDAQQTGRMNRFAVLSTCAAPKGYPGDFTTSGLRYYDSYTITNPTSAPVCATVGLSSACGTALFSAAYLGSFNPTAVSTNYLADPGSSFPGTAFYEVTIPANGTIVVVVHEVNPGTGCSGYNLRVDVPGSTVAPTAGSNSPVCSGNALNLTSTGTGSGTPPTYAWSGPNSFTSSAQNPSIANATTLATGTYTVSVTNTNGCVFTATTAVTVNATPTATPSSNSPVCEGNTLNLTSGTATSYSWTGPNSFSSSSQNPSIGSVTTAANGTYSVTLTSANSCTASATIAVVINSVPIPSPSSDSPKCVGATLSLNAVSGMTSYAWTGPNSFSASTQNPTISSVTTAATGTYTVTVTNANGCSASATTAVTINQALPPTITPPSTLVICSPSTLALTASGCVGGTITWSEGAATGTNLTLNAIGTYSISATCTINGCTSDASTPVTGLEIKAKPASPTITPPSTLVVCSPSTLALTASGCTGGTITWSVGAATGTNLTLTAVGTYSISATCTVNGCTSNASTPVTGLEIKALPTSVPTSNSPICAGGTLNLSGSGGETYLWSGPNSYSSTDQNPILSNVGAASAGTYTLTVTTKGCSSSAQTVVAINTISVPAATGTTNLSCDVISVTRTASGGQSYIWSGGLGTNPTATIATAGTYTVTVTDANGCSATVSTVVTFTNNLQITQQPQNVSICQGNNATFTAQANLPGVTYQWEVNTGSGFIPVVASSVYSGQNTATLSLAFPSLAYNNYKYRCIITLNSCNATSNDATLSLSGSAEALNIVNVTPISGVYAQTAVAFTIALNKIEPNANVLYKSGNSIELLPGFETRAGAVFVTKIESPCGNNSGFTTNFENLPKEIRK
jgi:hypothetical protein